MTLRRPWPGCQVCVQRSRILASKAVSTARCAPLQGAMALLKMRCLAPSQLALMMCDSRPIVGVSSKSAVLSSWASARMTLRARASTISVYWRCDMRNCQGTYLMRGFAAAPHLGACSTLPGVHRGSRAGRRCRTRCRARFGWPDCLCLILLDPDLCLHQGPAKPCHGSAVQWVMQCLLYIWPQAGASRPGCGAGLPGCSARRWVRAVLQTRMRRPWLGCASLCGSFRLLKVAPGGCFN